MVPILSFTLLLNKNSDVIGTSLVRFTSFSGKIYYVLPWSQEITYSGNFGAAVVYVIARLFR